MVSKVFQLANRIDDERIMMVNGDTFVCQTIIPHDNVFIINPNDGKSIRKAGLDSSPMLLGIICGSTPSYYEDAIITYHHPHSTDPDFVGLYVLDRSKEPARVASNDFNARRQARIAENEANGNGPYIPQAQRSQGAAVVNLFGKRAAPEIVSDLTL